MTATELPTGRGVVRYWLIARLSAPERTICVGAPCYRATMCDAGLGAASICGVMADAIRADLQQGME